MFLIPFEPKPQSRPRATVRGRHAAVYEDPKMMRWRKQVTDYIKENYDGCYFDGAVCVKVTFYMRAPRTYLKSRQSVQKIKLSNYIQNTFQSCCGTLKSQIWTI